MIEAAIADHVANIIGNMLDKPWWAYILAKLDDKLVISGGASQNIQPGDTFTVLEKGKMVKNPQTNMMIELPGKKLLSKKSTVLSVRRTEGNALWAI